MKRDKPKNFPIILMRYWPLEFFLEIRIFSLINFRSKFEFGFFVYVLHKQGMDLKMGQARRVQAKTQNFASTRVSSCHVIQPPDPPASYANKDEKGLNRVLVSEKWKTFLLFQDRIRKVGRTNANVVENRKYKCMQNFVATLLLRCPFTIALRSIGKA